MKKNLLSIVILVGLLLASCEKEDITITKVMSLESKLSNPQTEWKGDKSGKSFEDSWGGTIWKNQFTDDTNMFIFDNYYADYYWGGFMYTNKSDATTAGFTNNSAITGKAKSGQVYLTANNSSSTPAVVSFKGGESYKVEGMYVTNSTYAYLSMKNGDSFAKKFASGDWFKLEIFGKDSSGNKSSNSATFYLADFRDGKTKLVNEWEWIDLTSLGEVNSLHFELSSTDNGDYGMNTPSYFCVDDITIIIEE